MVSESSFNLKNSEIDNLWAFYQKFLVFEEPARKWLHIAKAANQKGYIDFLAKAKSFAANPDKSKNNISSNLVNVLIAYEEASCFQTSVLQRLEELHLEKYLPASRIDYWQKILHVDHYLAQWLTLAEIYWPDKDEIINLKDQDSRLEFLKYCWQIFENKNNENVKGDWHQSIKLFQQCLSFYRTKLPADFLPTAIILVEGLTEQILLPYFAASCGMDLCARGIMLVSAGGAKQIVRKYIYWQEKLNLSIFCLFDTDAKNLADSLLPNLRKSDNVYILTDGEIENIMQLDFLVDKVNSYLSQDLLFDKSKSISAADFATTEKRTLILDKIWRHRELGKFEKVKFAQFIANHSFKIDYKFLSDGGKSMFIELAKSIDAINK